MIGKAIRPLRRLPWRRILPVVGMAVGVPVAFEAGGANGQAADTAVGNAIPHLEAWLIFAQSVIGAGLELLRQRRAAKREVQP